MKALIILTAALVVQSFANAGHEVLKDQCGLFAVKKALEQAPNSMTGEEYQQKKVTIDVLDVVKTRKIAKNGYDRVNYIVTVGFSGISKMQLAMTVLETQSSRVSSVKCVLAASEIHSNKIVENYDRVPASY